MTATLHHPHAARAAAGRPRWARGYSLLEMLITVLIIQIISTMVLANIGDVEASERLNRAAIDVVNALRYTRAVAMSTGSGNQPVGIEFDTTSSYMRVFAGPSAATVANSLAPNGIYYVQIPNQRDTTGVKISAVTLSNSTTSSPYRVVYGVMGSTVNNGYVTLKYANQTKIIQIPPVGDPKIQ